MVTQGFQRFRSKIVIRWGTAQYIVAVLRHRSVSNRFGKRRIGTLFKGALCDNLGWTSVTIPLCIPVKL